MLTENFSKLLNECLGSIKDEIIQEMQQKDFVASGRTIDSFEIEIDEPFHYGALIGLKSFQTIVKERLTDGGKGRRPTSNSGSGELYRSILQWIDDKGIEPEKGTKEGLAYAISKKIHKQGTALYRDERDGVDLKEIKNRNIELFLMRVRKEIQGAVIKNFKNVVSITEKN